MNNKKTATLIKVFNDWGDKIIYQGTLRGCKKENTPQQERPVQNRI